jgi:hypothetical protein
MYSGEADPGATLVVSLFNAKGENIGSQTVVVDAGGNWLASFPSTTVRDIPNSVQISQLSASYSRGDTFGHNLRTYFSPALNQGHFFLSATGANLSSEPAPLLGGLGLENPLQLGSVNTAANSSAPRPRQGDTERANHIEAGKQQALSGNARGERPKLTAS